MLNCISGIISKIADRAMLIAVFLNVMQSIMKILLCTLILLVLENAITPPFYMVFTKDCNYNSSFTSSAIWVFVLETCLL